MQTSPPRGFTRHVISTPRPPHPWPIREEGRSRAVVFTLRHLRRRRRCCQAHTRLQYKIYTRFTQWSISYTGAFLSALAHNGRSPEDLSFIHLFISGTLQRSLATTRGGFLFLHYLVPHIRRQLFPSPWIIQKEDTFSDSIKQITCFSWKIFVKSFSEMLQYFKTVQHLFIYLFLLEKQ